MVGAAKVLFAPGVAELEAEPGDDVPWTADVAFAAVLEGDAFFSVSVFLSDTLRSEVDD